MLFSRKLRKLPHLQFKTGYVMKPRKIISAALAAALVLLSTQLAWAAEADFTDIKAAIAEQHDEGVQRLQEWIALPSIAAENQGFPAGPEHMARLLKEAGFQRAEIIETDGLPGVFATLDAGAEKSEHAK